MFEIEKQKLFQVLSNEILTDLLDEFNAIVAGGVISRIFSGRDTSTSDVDVYFRSKDDLAEVLYGIRGTSNIVFDYTEKSVMIKSDETVVQFILIDTFQSAEDIFSKFDFTCVMGAYDFKTNEFILHPEFLLHNSQRVLKFNTNTMYPIISAMRVDKYKKEGYKISRFEYVKILMTIMNLNINSWDEFDKQMGRFYGIGASGLVELNKNCEFSIEAVLNSMQEIGATTMVSPHERHKKEIYDYNKFVLDITGIKPYSFKFLGGVYSPIAPTSDGVCSGFVVVTDSNKHCYQEPSDIGIDQNKVYKYVKKDGERYFSYNDSSFEYKIGDTVSPRNPSSSSSGLYCVYSTGIVGCQYSEKEDAVLLECEILDRQKDIKIEAYNPSAMVVLNRLKVIREVPKDERVKGSILHGFIKEECPF